jgi:hypothetical protein
VCNGGIAAGFEPCWSAAESVQINETRGFPVKIKQMGNELKGQKQWRFVGFLSGLADRN